MAKIIVVDGPDNAGKTTFIRDICEISDRYVVIDFPKRTEDGRFDIKSRNEVNCFETMLNYLDPTKIYVLDRGYISNWVYGKLRLEEDFEKYEVDFNRLVDNHTVLPIILTRNEITTDFKDDLISLSAQSFNAVIKHFEDFALDNDCELYQLINHYGNNKIKGLNAGERDALVARIIKWAK